MVARYSIHKKRPFSVGCIFRKCISPEGHSKELPKMGCGVDLGARCLGFIYIYIYIDIYFHLKQNSTYISYESHHKFNTYNAFLHPKVSQCRAPGADITRKHIQIYIYIYIYIYKPTKLKITMKGGGAKIGETLTQGRQCLAMFVRYIITHKFNIHIYIYIGVAHIWRLGRFFKY